jgi:hypothetical protein
MWFGRLRIRTYQRLNSKESLNYFSYEILYLYCNIVHCNIYIVFIISRFGQNMKIIHFIAASKPWLQSFNTETRVVTPTSGGTGLQTLLQFWWDLFCQYVHPSLSTEMVYKKLLN